MAENPDSSNLDNVDSQENPAVEADIDIIAVRRSAMDLLARREHACFELERKLLRRYPRPLIKEVIERLADEGLQSDERFAESYVRQRAGRGYGPARIQRELQERGVEDNLAASTVAVSGIDWHDIARQAVEKKYGALVTPLPLVEKARILRFLAYRGFSREHLPTVLG